MSTLDRLGLTYIIMKSALKAYWLFLSVISGDISLLYRNFFHWTASKVAIWLYALVFGTVLSLPAIGLIVWALFSILSPVPESSLSLFASSGDIDEKVLGALTGHSGLLIGVGLLAVVIVAIYGFMLAYAYFLEIRLYAQYLEGKRLPILKNLYFSRYHLKKFLGVLSWTSLYLLPPLVVGMLILLVLFLLRHFGVLNETNRVHNMILGSVSLIGAVGCIVWMLVIAIRTTFGYMLLLQAPENPTKTARSYVTDSLSLTKGKVWKMI